MAKFGTQGSNERDIEYGTPKWFLQPISEAVGGFDLDPASGAENSPHADTTYTKADDGLSKTWNGTVWCNPPFSDKEAWLEKAWKEYQDGNADLVLVLLPVDTSTGWFHEYVTMADLLWFKEGRLSFDGSSNWSPNFGIMIAVYGDVPEELVTQLSHTGMTIENTQVHNRTEQESLGEFA